MNAELLVLQAAELAGLPGAAVFVDGAVRMSPTLRGFLQLLNLLESSGELSLVQFAAPKGGK